MPSLKVLKPRKSARRILGIDPGLAGTGWGVLDTHTAGVSYVDHGIIKTKADCPRAQRLFFIMQSIRLIIEKFNPTEAAVEILFFGRNVTSAIPVAEARGVISACLAEKDIPLQELTPNAIKKGVTGIARADKKQVQEMVRLILALEEIPKPDHCADALAAAICAANSGLLKLPRVD